MLEIEHPRVLEHANQWDSLVRVFLKEFVHQVFVLLRKLRLKRDLLLDLVSRNGYLITTVRGITMHQFV